MANGADIVITVDSSQIRSATSELDRLGLTVVKQSQTVQRLERYYSLLDKAFNSGKLSAQQYSNGMQQVDRAIEAVQSGQMSLTTTQEKLTASTQRATTAVNQQAVALQQSQKANRQFELGIQQAGFQVGDFFVQVASGTNPMVAFTQQATQLAGFFAGPWGAIIGAALSIFGAVAIAMGAMSDKTTELTFNFQKFGQDMRVAIEPLMPIIRALGEAFNLVKSAVVSAINGILNALRMLGAAVGAVPDAFGSLVGLVDAQMFRLELVVRGYVASIQSVIQGMFDMISGSPAMVNNAQGQLVSVAERFQQESAYYSGAAGLEAQNIANTPGPGDIIGQAVSNVQPIDIGSYFSRTPVSGGGGGGGGATLELQNKLEEIYQYLELDKYLIEQETIAFEQRQDVLRSALEAKMLTVQEYNELEKALALQHQQDLANIESESRQQRLSDTANMFGQLANIASVGGQKTVKVVAAFQAVEGTINAYGAAIKALNTPGITLAGRFAAYASVLAAGLKGVAAIRSAGGVGGGASGGGGGSRGSATVAQSTAPATPQTVLISGLDPNALFTGEQLSRLFENFYKENDNRGKVFVVAR